MNVAYSDFIRLFNIQDPNNWEIFYIKKNGVYIQSVKGYLRSEEREALTQHPTGNLNEPAFPFPSDMESLEKFVEFYGLNGYIDPFEMAAWVHEKASGKGNKQPKTPTKSRPATEKDSMLRLVLGMAIHAYDYQIGAKRNPATGTNKGSIQSALERVGLSMDANTIRNCIKEAEDRFSEELQKQHKT